jgi:hypothetical protein
MYLYSFFKAKIYIPNFFHKYLFKSETKKLKKKLPQKNKNQKNQIKIVSFTQNKNQKKSFIIILYLPPFFLLPLLQKKKKKKSNPTY